MLLAASFASCSVRQSLAGRRITKAVRQSAVFEKSLTGFVLMDPVSGRLMGAVNAHKHFIPASNTKLLTFYTCLQVLGDTLPRLRYRLDPDNDSAVWIAGVGDPTLLHPDFAYWANDTFPPPAMTPKRSLYIQPLPGALELPPWGNGWAWDDFGEAYSAERSDMPVYGNKIQIEISNHVWRAQPEILNLSASGQYRKSSPYRHHLDARFDLPDLTEFPADTTVWLDIPMFQAAKQSRQMLERAWGCTIQDADSSCTRPLFQKWHVTPRDTVCRKMMIDSDNFLAEQLLLLCSGEKLDSLSTGAIIQWAKDSLMQNLPDPMRWVDGSGLSRYNLNTPANMAVLLQKLWEEQSNTTLLSFFPAGGVSGTLQGHFGGLQGQPYVFAKSGSMSGVYCLSGYIRTRKGRWLIFSFMNNHFIGSNQPWKEAIQGILEQIYQKM